MREPMLERRDGEAHKHGVREVYDPFRGAVRRGLACALAALVLAAAGAWLWQAPDESLRVAATAMFALLCVAAVLAAGSVLALNALRGEGRRMGPYRLEGVIEEGGMATVHRGEGAQAPPGHRRVDRAL